MKSLEERHQARLFFAGLSEKNTQTDDIFPSSPYFCSACGKPIQEDPSKSVLLKCNHNFCLSCIKKLAESQIIGCCKLEVTFYTIFIISLILF